MSSKLQPFTFESCGEVIQIRGVPPATMIAVEQAYPPPRPPLISVDYDGEKVLEPNPHDPTYLQAKAVHDGQHVQRVQGLMIRVGCVVEMTPTRIEALAEQRQTMDDLAIPYSGNDTLDWVLHVAARGEDYRRLMDAIGSYTAPPEEVIAIAEGTFQGHVERATAKGGVP